MEKYSERFQKKRPNASYPVLVIQRGEELLPVHSSNLCLQPMESAIAAVAGELVSRFISFAFNRFFSSSSYEDEGWEEKRERLRHLLMRAHTVVEEADARYITSSGMLMQLKILSEAMYQSYHALDTLTFQLHDDEEASTNHKVRDSPISLCSATRLKRPRTALVSVKKDTVHAALHNLETAVANISEFVVLLCGCDERLSRRPYDAYLYIGNFVFGRHAEKQKLLNFLLQHNPSDYHDASPPILPVIGALGVGKKTLVSHVCADERVRSKFALILHLNGDNFLNIVDHKKALVGISALVVVEFVSDVEDVEWNEFYSFLTRTTSTRSKVIIISKVGRLARFGSIRPIFLDALSYEELWYLFKNLVFGSADPAEHPRLVHIAEGFAKELHQAGSLVTANALADVLRSNLNAPFWLSILNRCRKVIEKNLFTYGQHPNLLFEQGREVDVTEFISSPVISPLRILPCSTSSALAKTELPKVAFGKLLLDPSVRPKGEFNLLTWESRLPPYTSFIHFVPNCTQDMPEGHSLSGRKRHTVPF